MAQVKIYGLRDRLNPIKSRLSDIVHASIVETLRYPADKRFHRFFPLDAADFFFAGDRTDQYTIIEISMFEGRTTEAKKQLIRLLFQKLSAELDVSTQDIEITISETPRHDWGIRGLPGDELTLNYKVNV